MEKKQTVVEWLVEQVFMGNTNQWQLEIDQALEMEKEQIRDAFNSGMNDSVDYFMPFLNPNDESENYYNKKFKSE